MIKIETSQNWDSFDKIFGMSAPQRLEWFYFEFGRRATKLIFKEFMSHVSKVRGSKEYKKQFIIAEIRDKDGRAWFAIVSKARKLKKDEIDGSKSILEVIPRFELKSENPIDAVLVKFGPWTPETIPFAPSSRQASVVAKTVTKEAVATLSRANKAREADVRLILDKFGVEFEGRPEIYEKLKIIPDQELNELRMEFGLLLGGVAHWRPAVRYARRQMILKLMKDTDLLKAFTEPRFTGYRIRKHVRPYMTNQELKAIQKFQDKISNSVG